MDTQKWARHKLYALYYTGIWTFVILSLMALNIYQSRQAMRNAATAEARVSFNRDQAFRFWATSHGGVYVPIDENTPPNPYLEHIPERDIETPSGVQLTLMNPAYMIRQMNEEFSSLYGIEGHITSLNPLRPQNAPDEWERYALEQFELGETEVFEFTKIDNEPYLRLIQPMVTQEGCLKCHGFQGYEVGDIRGGIGVSVPMASHLQRSNQEIIRNLLSFTAVWGIGIVGIGIGSRNLGFHLQQQTQVESILRESELRYRQMFQDNSAIKLLIDPTDGSIMEANTAACEFYGYSKKDMHKQNIININQLSEQEVKDEMARAKAQKRIYFNFRHKIASGEIRDVEVYSGPVVMGGQQLLFSIIHDITERKQAEEQLRQSHERFNLVLDSLNSIVYVADMETYEILFVNEYARNLFGDITGRTCWKALQTGQTRPCDFCTNDKLIDADGNLQSYTWEFQNTLTKKWYLIYDRAIHWIDGRVVRMEIATDITARKQMEEAIQENESRATALLKAIPDLMFRLDKDGVFLDYKADESQLYEQGASIVGKKNRDISPPEFADLIEEKIKQTLDTGEMQTFEYQLPIKQQGLIDYEARMFKSGDDEVIAIVRDVTERKLTERHHMELELGRKRMQLLTSFITKASHEFRTPLSVIETSLYLQEKAVNNVASQQKHRQKIREQTNAILSLVESLNAMVRLENISQLDIHPINLNQIIESLVEELQSESQSKQIVIQQDLDENIPDIQGDFDMLALALRHLIDNAIRYSSGQSSIAIKASQQDDEVIISIKDTGIGMTDEQQEHIFELFYRVDKAHSTRGFGLGLPIAKKAISLHQGHIEVESALGEGTRVEVCLPIEMLTDFYPIQEQEMGET